MGRKGRDLTTEAVFTMALGLEDPWFLERVDFKKSERELTIWIDFHPGSLFTCSNCGQVDCSAYDTKRSTWRHLDFFEFKTKLFVRHPRVRCRSCGGTHRVAVPWAREGGGFSLEFESKVMSLACDIPISTLGRHLGETNHRLWRLVTRHVESARADADFSDVTQIGIDETAARRGHNYITLFVDMATARVLFATEGKGMETIGRFVTDLRAHGGDPGAITDVCMDMSPSFRAGVAKYLSNAEITFDRFHLVKLMQVAVDEVRRGEQREHGGLKSTRFIWLKNPSKLTRKQKKLVFALSKEFEKMGRAYRLKEAFRAIWRTSESEMIYWLESWYSWAVRCRLDPIRKFAKTVKAHWDGIVRWSISRLANGILEGINSLVQAAKAKARGYRKTENMITMTYLVAGKLDYGLPT